MMEEIRITGIAPNNQQSLEKRADHDIDDTQQKIARHSAYSGVYRGAMSCMPPLFELLAGLWVFLYEQAVPSARSEAQQGILLDELHASTAKLRIRRDELHARIKASAADAKKVHAKGDTKGLRSRLIVIRRLKTQVERIESSLLTIETNIDEIINSDVTREIIDSLRRSTEAMKGQVLPMGGVEGVQETVDDLQAEMAASQDMQDAIYKGLAALPPMNTIVEGEEGDGNEESLIHELNSFLEDADLRDSNAATNTTSAGLDAMITAMPDVPSAAITASTTSVRSTSISSAASWQDGGALAE